MSVLRPFALVSLLASCAPPDARPLDPRADPPPLTAAKMADPSTCADAYTYTYTTKTVSTSATWTSPSVSIKGALTVKKGVTLTISGGTLSFGLNGSITVEDGAKLVLNKTTVQGLSSCGTTWVGAYVWGASYKSTGYGVLTASNATISDMRNGLSTMRPSTWSQTGGQLNLSGTTFKNNRRSIEFMGSASNGYTNSSTVDNNTFVTTSLGYPYTSSDTTSAHITAYHTILGDIDTSSFSGGEKGIYSIDASYSVYQNDFEDLTYGVYSDNSGSWETGHVIESNGFTEVFSGVRIEDGSGDALTGNIFNVGGGAMADNFYGIYLDGTTDFDISENIFDGNTYGIVIIDGVSGEVGGRIGNYFEGNWRGLHTMGDNSEVLVRCNGFDIDSASLSAGWYNGGTMGTQGSSSAGVSNSFVNTSGGAVYDIYAGTSFTYYYTGSAPTVYNVTLGGAATTTYCT